MVQQFKLHTLKVYLVVHLLELLEFSKIVNLL